MCSSPSSSSSECGAERRAQDLVGLAGVGALRAGGEDRAHVVGVAEHDPRDRIDARREDLAVALALARGVDVSGRTSHSAICASCRVARARRQPRRFHERERTLPRHAGPGHRHRGADPLRQHAATTTARRPATTPNGASTTARSAATRCWARCAKALGPAAPLRALARGRRRHRLLQPQHAPGRLRGRRRVHRHLPRDARRAAGQRAAPGPRRRAPSPATPRSCRSRTTSLRPRLRPRRAAPPARPRPRLRRVPPRAAARRAAVLRGRAVALRRPHRPASPSAPRTASRRCGGGSCAPRPAAAGHSDGGEANHQLEAFVDVHAFTPDELSTVGARAGLVDVRVRGEELLANWFGWANRALEATADPDDGPVGLEGLRLQGLPGLQEVDRRLLEPRLPPAIFYNLIVSARKPGYG